MNKLHIDAHTTVCAVMGNPVEHSLSPAIHNAAFAACGLNWVYVAFRVEEIEKAIHGIRALGIRGVSITIPHKISALPLVDTSDETARVIGSINTIVNSNGILTGYNSDGDGALKALRDAGCNPEHKNVIILGSGGAARAIAVTLAVKAIPRKLVILGIIEQEYRQLLSDIAQKTALTPAAAMLTDEILAREITDCDIIINASPVGMYPNTDCSPVPQTLLNKNLTVFDVVYNPKKTRLLHDAEHAGCTIISGIEMFLNQALIQFELWTGHPAPEAVMRAELEKHFT